MKVRFQGFAWSLANGITESDFVDELMSVRGKRISLDPYERILFAETVDDNVIGLFLSIKDIRRYTALTKKKDGALVLESVNLSENSSIADFNFFGFNRRTLRGIYSHYHHSCSVRQFGVFCGHRH